jgi:glycosyltransferase involved in cell wall biosynthesis
LKVLHLTGETQDAGGVLSVIRQLEKATRCQGWSHAVWVHQSFVETRQPALSYRFSPHICADSSNHVRILFGASRAVLSLRRLLSREHFDILHAHTRGTLLVGLMVAKLLRRSVLFTNHNIATRVGLYRWAAAQPNLSMVLLTPSMARHYGLVSSPPKISIISACCADAMFVEPLEPRSGERDPSRPLGLVGLGSIVHWKNWHLLLEALLQLAKSDLQQIQFHHWGPTLSDRNSQTYERELREIVARNHLEKFVQFNGMTSAIASCLHECDWFILPSTNEPCSVALIEALALGVPSLVSDSGGNIDIVSPEKTGLFFESESASDLAGKLRRILHRDVDLLPPTAIRDSVRHRSASEIGSQYLKLYSRLIGLTNGEPSNHDLARQKLES